MFSVGILFIHLKYTHTSHINIFISCHVVFYTCGFQNRIKFIILNVSSRCLMSNKLGKNRRIYSIN